MKLGVNIDHIATLRQARRELNPDPVSAVRICERAGADSIVAHLREDRRHINERDVFAIRKEVKKRFNLEMSLHPDIVNIALKIKPDQVTLVPEHRQELTTEGGLNVFKNFFKIQKVFETLSRKGIEVSLFIDPIEKQIQKSRELGISVLEFHTGLYSKSSNKQERSRQLNKLIEMTDYARTKGFTINAGHGLDYVNVSAISRISGINELNIGHSIISQAVFIGLENAVRMMKDRIKRPVV